MTANDSMDELDNDLLENQNAIMSQHASQQQQPSQHQSQNNLNNSYQSAKTPNISMAEIDYDLFNRLLKTHVLKANPNIKIEHEKNMVILDQESTESYNNGMVFANYLIVLKSVLAQQLNQDFAIDSDLLQNMKDQPGAQSRLFNWNYLCTELDVSTLYSFVTALFISENWHYCRERRQSDVCCWRLRGDREALQAH